MQILHGTNQYETPGLMIPHAEWQDIVDLCAFKRRTTRPREDKWKTGWISPAVLHPGASSRKLSDVERMSDWIGLDVDHANWSLKQLLTYFTGMACVIYSTTRSSDLERRWRVLVPVSREMTLAEFTGVWRALNLLLDGEVDARTKNLNRLHYLPATWIGGNNEYHVQDGFRLDVDELLEVCPSEEPVYYTEIFETEGVRAPDGTEIITASMVERHMLGGIIGGRFIKLMCAAATRYKANGWALSASELANAALAVSPLDSSGMSRAMSAMREAERALSYIDIKVETVSPKYRLMNNLRWKYGLLPVKSTVAERTL